MEKRKYKVLLVPFHQHLFSLYEGLIAKGCIVTGLMHESHFQVRHLGRVQAESMKIFVGYPLIFYRWFSIGFQVPKYIRGLSKKVTRLSSDVLVVFDFYHWYFLQALFIKRNNPSLKLIVYSESKRWPKRKFSSLLLQLFLYYAGKHQAKIDQVLVYTAEGREFLSQFIAQDKIKILPAPIDTTLFNSVSVDQSTSTEKELRILCNARFDLYKNHEDLLMAIQLLLRQGYKCKLTLIGRAETGKERVKKLVLDYGLKDCVTWLDPLPLKEMPNLYQSHDVLVLPSYNEALGLVVPEAMACGVPTITSDTVGANVYVVPNETGFIFETGNVQELMLALKVYLDMPEVRKQHGLSAARHIVINYSVEKITDSFLSLIRN
jgi:glycosyltransferase involved in cell wall biosynthesis